VKRKKQKIEGERRVEGKRVKYMQQGEYKCIPGKV
jgi:hypothetical protein